MKHCDDCNQEKPYDPSALPRSKASGFYGWQCWDCYKQNVLGRLHKRTGAQSLEYVALCAELENLVAKTQQVKARIRTLQEAAKEACRKAQSEARSARPKVSKSIVTVQSGERIRVMSLPYLELVAQAQANLSQFLQEVSKDHPDFEVRKWGLETKLEYAQNKLALFGPTAFDFMSAKAHE